MEQSLHVKHVFQYIITFSVKTLRCWLKGGNEAVPNTADIPLVLAVKHQSIHDSYWANDTVLNTANIPLMLAVKHQSIHELLSKWYSTKYSWYTARDGSKTPIDSWVTEQMIQYQIQLIYCSWWQ